MEHKKEWKKTEIRLKTDKQTKKTGEWRKRYKKDKNEIKKSTEIRLLKTHNERKMAENWDKKIKRKEDWDKRNRSGKWKKEW
jgi:hypothetical protein